MTESRGALVSTSLVGTEQVLLWFAETGRDLPWRQTRDPWVILVSEFMLQQTQVSRVVDRLPSFLSRFPTPTSLADKPVGETIEAWTGLGYNRRAVNLHRAAAWIRDEHGGRIPCNLVELQNLPGVGVYTSRAVRVFAFEMADGVVDTNIARVLARLQGRPLRARELQDLADRLVPPGVSWEWNQALMEIGAVLCRPRPLCEHCPLAGECTWFLAERPEPDPSVKSAKVSKPQTRFEGSDRQGRGRLVRALGTGPVPASNLAEVMGWPGEVDRAASVANQVIADGLAERNDGYFQLPR